MKTTIEIDVPDGMEIDGEPMLIVPPTQRTIDLRITLAPIEPLAIKACRKILEAKACVAGGGVNCPKLNPAHEYARLAIAEYEKENR